LNASLKNVLAGAAVLLAAAFAGQGWLYLYSGARLSSEAKSAAVLAQRIDVLQELSFDLLHLRALEARFVLAGNEAERERIDVQIAEALAKLDSDHRTYASLVPAGNSQGAAGPWAADMGELRALHGKVIAMVRESGRNGTAGELLNGELKTVSSSLQNSVHDSLEAVRTAVRTASTRAADMDAQTQRLAGLVLCGCLLLCGLLAAAMIRYMSRLAGGMADAVAALSEYDDALVPYTRRQDEFGVLARTFAQVLSRMKRSEYQELHVFTASAEPEQAPALTSLKTGAQMIAAVNDIAIDLTHLNISTHSATARAQAIASAATEMAASVKNISSNSEGAAANASEASSTVSAGLGAISNAEQAIDKLVSIAEETAHNVDGLSHASSQIGQMVSVIEGIASQTNLLALNAAIEAARAGETGRGFGVVAAEVKVLARQTASATEDIAKRMADLRNGMETIL
jgi:methyl-accepting chemotaxis protein